MSALVAPSILSADFLRLGEEVERMEAAGARILHVDVMDGHFVPNLTMGVPLVAALRRRTRLLLDVHLMISNPEEMVLPYIEAGADYLSVHYEAVVHLDRLLEEIRGRGAQPGVALNPHSPVCLLEEVVPRCHHVLLMSVNPGFGGQEFISSSFEKVRKLKLMLESRDLDVQIEIDGGIGPRKVREAVESGVDILVAGSAIFHSEDPAGVFARMQREADEGSRIRIES